MNLRAQLEKQLEGVMESAIPVPPSEIIAAEARADATAEPVPLLLSSTRELDARLIASLSSKGANKNKKLQVRIGDHVASPHLVEMGGLARKISVAERDGRILAPPRRASRAPRKMYRCGRRPATDR